MQNNCPYHHKHWIGNPPLDTKESLLFNHIDILKYRLSIVKRLMEKKYVFHCGTGKKRKERGQATNTNTLLPVMANPV